MKLRHSLFTASLASAALLAACGQSAPQRASAPAQESAAPKPAASIARASFGTLPDGTAVELFTLKNAGGMEVRVTNYGGP